MRMEETYEGRRMHKENMYTMVKQWKTMGEVFGRCNQVRERCNHMLDPRMQILTYVHIKRPSV